MPIETPIGSLLTLVITTSPTLSAPSTELLSTVLQSFHAHAPLLLDCRVIVVFDTYDHIAIQPRLKKGHVTLEKAESYSVYKDNVKNLFLQEHSRGTLKEAKLKQRSGEAEYGSAINPTVLIQTTSTEDDCITFVEAVNMRLGFGLAVRTALRMVQTAYVWVHQHDWALIHDIPIAPILSIMQTSESDLEKPMKYVCLPSGRRTLYATSDKVTPFPELRKLAVSLTAAYSPSGDEAIGVPLTPMFFWHDKPHIASTFHYLNRVFPTRLAMMRGAFIEDTIGQKARGQMKEGQWAKWATWLYNPDDGRQVCLKHLHGRTWRGQQEEIRVKAEYRERNRQQAEKQSEE